MSNKFTRSRIREIIAAAGLETRTARELTDKIVNAMTAALAAGEAIELRGFGSLELRERKARAARNPRTGEPLTAPPRRRVIFRPGQELKAALRGTPGSD